MASTIKRRDAIRVNLAPDMKERIDRLSGLMGLPPSTLAAVAVGQWVANMENALGASGRLVDVIGQQIGGTAAEEVKKQMGLFSKENAQKE